MDLEDYFPSIPVNWVVNFFRHLGYAGNVAFFLSSLCCKDGGLPQGAATSPPLSNLLVIQLDERLAGLAKSYDLRYTRYADDLAFSGGYIPHKFIKIVEEIVCDFGLSVNQSKTKLCVGQGRKVVTGLSVSGPVLKLPRSVKRSLRQQAHYVKQYGILSHSSKLRNRNPYYLESLIGKLAFWIQVEPDNDYPKAYLTALRGILNG